MKRARTANDGDTSNEGEDVAVEEESPLLVKVTQERRLLDLVFAKGDHADDAARSLWQELVQRAPVPFWGRVLRCVPFANAAAVDCFWLHTRPLWLSPNTSDELRDLLQECAMFAKQPWLLRKLRASGLYHARRNELDMLHDVGNEEACRLLLAEGFGVDNTDGTPPGYTPLFTARTYAVASCLLNAGADPSRVLLNETYLPRARVLDWLLDLRNEAVDLWAAAWRNLFAPGRQRHRDTMLDIVGVLAKWRCELPRDVIANVTDVETLAALCTYGYIPALPASAARHVTCEMLLWRPHTHRYCSDNMLTGCIRIALLVMHHLCPMLPRDLRHRVLILAFEHQK